MDYGSWGKPLVGLDVDPLFFPNKRSAARNAVAPTVSLVKIPAIALGDRKKAGRDDRPDISG
jgi:hypothetical protein